MPDAKTDVALYSKPESDVTACANPIIYKYMSHVLAGRLTNERVSDPGSRIVQRAGRLFDMLRVSGVDNHRLATVSAVAHIDFLRSTQQIGSSTPEDFGAEA